MDGKTNLLLDTNIVIGFLNGNEAIIRFFNRKETQKRFTISQITRMELLGFPNITQDEITIIQQFLMGVDVFALSDEVADGTIEFLMLLLLRQLLCINFYWLLVMNN
jgi:predicted nucleic acid-binding protein